MIDIDVEIHSHRLIIILADQAPSFDPTHVPPPDLTLPLEKRPLGKNGVYLIKNYVDEMNYLIPPEGGNKLTLVKYI